MKISTFTRLISSILLAFLAYAPAAYAAGSATAQFNVTARVGAICSVTANTLSFGDYTGLKADGVTTVSVDCTNGLEYAVGLSDGFYLNGALRRMKHSGSNDYLAYQLFNNAGRTTIWNTSSGKVFGTGTGLPQALTVYGRIPAAQSALTGDYSDTITVTVDYM
ncbi:MAG TPA: spore coat U domain-containing protein [Gallionellaceae bacterium]